VMGGRSAGSFYVDEDGHGIFKGHVSLENNGGFSSLRYRFKKMNTAAYTKIVLRVKGDGKPYQFRVKAKASDYYSYVSQFKTANEWETIEISLSDMYPAFRGRKLDIPNYSNDGIEEIAFLIGNKRTEDFILMIDNIALR
ncbi:MAG: CIA30 family protein, partial [Flavobacteriaceae bacterium]